MTPRVVQVLVAAFALGIAAPAAAMLALGSTNPSLYAYGSEGRLDRTACAVGKAALREPAPMVLEETFIVAELPRTAPPIEPAATPLTLCGPWRDIAAASKVRSCDPPEHVKPAPPNAPPE